MPFSPSDISGLGFWYRADAGVTSSGGLVSTWADQSGNGRDLTAAGGARPTTGTRTLNGLNVIDFDGSTDMMDSSAFTYGNGWTVFIVGQNDDGADSTSQTSFGANNVSVAAGRFLKVGSTNVFRLTSGTVLDLGTPDTAPHIHTLQFNGASSFLREDGAQVGSTGSTGTNTDANGVRLGAFPGAGSSFWDGFYLEIIGYNAVLTGDEIAQVEEYLNGRAALWPQTAITQTLPVLGQSLAADLAVTADQAETLPALGEAAELTATVTLEGAQALPSIGEALDATVTVTDEQAETLPVLGEAAAVDSTVTVENAQALPVLGESLTADAAATVDATETLPVLGEAAAIDAAATLEATETLPALGESATLSVASTTVEVAAAESLPAIGEALAADAAVTIAADLSLPALGESLAGTASTPTEAPGCASTVLSQPHTATITIDTHTATATSSQPHSATIVVAQPSTATITVTEIMAATLSLSECT